MPDFRLVSIASVPIVDQITRFQDQYAMQAHLLALFNDLEVDWCRLVRLHQSTAASTWWCGPRPRLGWVEMAVGLSEGPSYPGYSPQFFAMLPFERPQKGSTQLL